MFIVVSSVFRLAAFCWPAVGNFRSLERQTKEGADDMVSLAKWRILNRLHDRNETLYYKVNAIMAKYAYSTNAYLLFSQ